jgi:hypothetical protein
MQDLRNPRICFWTPELRKQYEEDSKYSDRAFEAWQKRLKEKSDGIRESNGDDGRQV